LADVTAQMSPAKTMYNSNDRVNELPILRETWPKDGNGYLVWFDAVGRKYLFTVDELQTIADMQEIAKLGDGAIYSVSRKH